MPRKKQNVTTIKTGLGQLEYCILQSLVQECGGTFASGIDRRPPSEAA